MSALWSDRPAAAWLERYPLGNGTLGAMCDGGAPARLQLNDETAWSGSPGSAALPAAEVARAGLAAARAALDADDPIRAEEALRALQSSHSQAYLPFVEATVATDAGTADPAGLFETTVATDAASARPEARDAASARPGTRDAPGGADAAGAEGTASDPYRRTLDLERGLHLVERGGRLETTFVSGVDGVLVHLVDGGRITSVGLTSPLRVLGRIGGPMDAECALLLRLPSDVAPGHEPGLPAARWSARPGDALEGAVVARVLDGRRALLIATATTFTGIGKAPSGDARTALAAARARLDAAAAHGPRALLDRHVAAHAERMGRVRIAFGPGTGSLPPADMCEIQDETPPTSAAHGDSPVPSWASHVAPTPPHGAPTWERVTAASGAHGHPLARDPGLAALLFDYGRYLLAASAGVLPPTLQGIWNDSMRPPWSSNHTLNINAQMALWPASVAAVPEAHASFARLVRALAASGADTARRLYDAPGWVAHHNSDAWAFTGIAGGGHGDARWAFWPMAGPWLVQQLWEPFAFGQAGADEARRLWPVIRGAAEFGLAWLRTDAVSVAAGRATASGAAARWRTSPATSPENAYLLPDGRAAALDTTTAADLALLRELFRVTVACAGLIGRGEDEVAVRARERAAELPAAPEIAADGTLLEWSRPRREEDPHHRHLSHLVGLYPGPGDWDAAHRAAAAATLERRGDESSGWSLAWKLALWARLGRGDRVGELLALVLRPADDARGPWAGGLYPNLFAAHPPFQLDGNLGFVAGLAEALVQSHDGIHLLPALPPELPEGHVRGLIARPGVAVDLAWRGGRLKQARLRPLPRMDAGRAAPRVLRIRYGTAAIGRALPAGEELALGPADFAAAAR